MMIQAAVTEARHQHQDEGKPRSTAFIKAIASEAAHSSSRGLKIAVAALALLLVVALVGLVVVLIMNRMEADEGRLRDRQLQQQVAQGPAGARIAAAYNGAIYLLVERSPAGVENGLCTAFAVRHDLLATNAHCVVAMERRQGVGATYFALPNGGRGEHLAISSMWRHPGYQADGEHPSADVGLVQIQGAAPVQVTLAPLARVQQLGPGDEIYVYGFPGDLVNVGSPVATITNGMIGRTVAFDGTGADAQNAQLIQHSAFTSPGTSGSPIFDRDGQVIAVNAGTFRTAQQQQIVGPLGPEAQTVVTESGYKYGVRGDLLASLLAGLGR
jgi:V8-like Glu-specific endopeptidase